MVKREVKGAEGGRLQPLTKRKAWKELQAHYKQVRELHLRDLFADDPKRGERFTAEGVGIFLDYSKNRVTDETLALLVELAEESRLRPRIDAMFQGEKINITEKRAVLHAALRAPRDASILVDGENVVPQVHAVLDKMAEFANYVREGGWKGHTGKRIRNIINIGIGGGGLGARQGPRAVPGAAPARATGPLLLDHHPAALVEAAPGPPPDARPHPAAGGGRYEPPPPAKRS